jgi:nucleotide-binding universal stress UspA family protein
MKLVIAYDGSECARDAIENLACAGLGPNVSAKVVCVADVWLPPQDLEAEGQLPAPVTKGRALARQAFEDALATAREGAALAQKLFPSWQVDAEAQADSPAWGVIKLAAEWHAELIVLGSHGRSALSRVVLGSVSQKVAIEAPCSVRIGRRRPRAERAEVRILVAYDGSPWAEAALEAVAARHWPVGTAARVVTVMEVRALTDLANEQSQLHKWLRPEDRDAKPAFERMLHAAVQRLNAAGLQTSGALLDGDAKQLLLEEATRFQADNVFVGARGLNFLQRFLLGSVSASLAARAPCSVEIVRRKNNNA